MYIGDTDDGTGLHQMVWEVISNCIDEHLAGHCRRVAVVLEQNGSISIDDDGRGIPVDEDETGKRFAERVFTELHVTPTRDGHTPHAHVGLLGVGLAVVSALSGELELEVRRDSTHWRGRFARGVATTPLRRRGSTRRTGTLIRFRPDPEIFTTTDFNYELIRTRLSDLAAVSDGLVFDLRDERRRKARLAAPNGVADLLIAERRRSRPAAAEVLVIREQVAGTRVDAAIEWAATGGVSVATFGNPTRDRLDAHPTSAGSCAMSWRGRSARRFLGRPTSGSSSMTA